MNFAKAENYWPTFRSNEQATALKEYQIKLYKDKKEAVNYLERIKRRQLLDMGNWFVEVDARCVVPQWNSKINWTVLLRNSIIVLFKKHIKGVHRENVSNLNKLITAVSNLI